MSNFFSNINSELRKMEKPDFISQYRDSLMGIAILWIVLFHSGIDVGKHSGIDFGIFRFLSVLITFLKFAGYLGVDIFFFVSGFGLMVSWYKKNNQLFFFYKRRFLRIIPMYWFFHIIDLVLRNLFGTPINAVPMPNLMAIFTIYTGFSFFISSAYYSQWFISTILLCYLVFPFFGNGFKKNNDKLKFSGFIVVLCLILAFVLTISAFYFKDTFSYLLIAVLRLPAFFMGSLIGYAYIKKDTGLRYLFSIYFNIFFSFLCFVILILVFHFCSTEEKAIYGLYWYPFVLGSFSLTFVLSIFLELLSKRFKFILNFLTETGKSSLELYFIHSYIFDYKDLIFRYFAFMPGSNYKWIAAIIISVVLAIMFNRILYCLNILFKYINSATHNV